MIKIVNDDSFTIGRSLDCTIPLTEDSISRVHLIVHRRQDQIWIEDKGSSNGTFVNNVRIAQNSLVNVAPKDRIRVGKSDYVVCISLEIEEHGKDSLKDLNNADATDVLDTKQSPKIQMPFTFQSFLSPKEKKPEVKEEVKPEIKPEEKYEVPAHNHNPAQYEAEKILHEAHKKAAQIIYDGELQAEKKSQIIYVEARERQAQAEVFYQKKVQEAHKEADKILLDFEKQGKELLEQARAFAQGIRDEVDTFARSLREKAWREAEDIALQARKESETYKQEAYEKARSNAEVEAAELVVAAKAEYKNVLNLAAQEAEELLSKTRTEMEVELRELKEQLEHSRREVTASLQEQEKINNKSVLAQKEQQSVLKDLEKVKKELSAVRIEDDNLQAKVREKKKASEDLESKITQLSNESKALEKKNKELQGQIAHFSLDLQAAEEQKKTMEKDLVHQKTLLKERLEKESQQLIKESERRVEESQLEMNKRLQKLEQEMLEEILGRKENLVKDILVIVETRIAKVLEPAKWDQISSQIFEGISETIEGKAVTFSENSKIPKESSSLLRKKKKENFLWMYGGITAGIATSFLGLQVYNHVVNDRNPMRTIAAEASRKRLEDLDRRKFNPTQVNEIKDSYVDSVVYTTGFVAAYQNPEFQQNLYKAASAYLLKTWRVDEDKSIQVLSMSSALIKELNDKRQNIHPDYVKDSIAKMRVLEKESLERMKTLLGSEVRLESYRRFERKFFENEVLKK